METQSKTKLNQPHVNTLMAEINIVKIGNKQMTISVFNQLYEEDCYDEDSNIIYPIWGKVKREAEWVIFQKGNDLRKCLIPGIITINSFEREVRVNLIHGSSSLIDEGIFDIIKQTDKILNHKKGYNIPRIWNGETLKHEIDTREISLEEANEWLAIDKPLQILNSGYRNNEIDNEGIKTLFNLLSKKDIYELKNNYVINRSHKEAWNKMVSELNNSKQIFIAV